MHSPGRREGCVCGGGGSEHSTEAMQTPAERSETGELVGLHQQQRFGQVKNSDIQTGTTGTEGGGVGGFGVTA